MGDVMDLTSLTFEAVTDEVIKVVEIFSRKKKILPSTPLIQEGFIDSLSVFQIISALEKAFHLKIKPMDATLADFASPVEITKLILNLKNK